LSNGLVIAIDGPAGAGKSTVSKILARDLGLNYLDTGAMYRAVAFKVLKLGVEPQDQAAIAQVASEALVSFGLGDPQPVYLDNEEITGAIRTQQISELASSISAYPDVRRALVALQREMVARGNVVLEGRDATTVIAPDAQVKIYLTASLEERAKRRSLELDGKGQSVDFEDVRSQISVRDHRDITRADSPLRVAKGATLVESAGLTPQEVADKIKRLALAFETET